MALNITSAVILAAGKGERLFRKDKSSNKPLTSLFDRTFLERAILNLVNKLKVNTIYVVIGFKNEEVENHLDNLNRKIGANIISIYEKEWEKGNGRSFIAALRQLREKNFFLIMSDHLFSPKLYKKIIQSDLKLSKSFLLASKELSVYNDFADATKVYHIDHNVKKIGKELDEHNAYDAGFFILNKNNFNNIDDLSIKDKLNLSEVMKELIKKKNLDVIEISKDDWFDIDTKQDLKNAEQFLIDTLKSKINDGPVSKLINRPISKRITLKIAKYKLHPNQISVFVFLLAALAGFVISKEGYFFLLFGAIIAQFSSIIDGCDGEIARIKMLESKFCKWFDQVLDRYSDLFILIGLTFHCYHLHNNIMVFFIGSLTAGTKIILSYTAYEYDKYFENSNQLRIGRDFSIFIILLGALFNIPYLTLIILTIIFNFEIVRRIYSFKKKFNGYKGIN